MLKYYRFFLCQPTFLSFFASALTSKEFKDWKDHPFLSSMLQNVNYNVQLNSAIMSFNSLKGDGGFYNDFLTSHRMLFYPSSTSKEKGLITNSFIPTIYAALPTFLLLNATNFITFITSASPHSTFHFPVISSSSPFPVSFPSPSNHSNNSNTISGGENKLNFVNNNVVILDSCIYGYGNDLMNIHGHNSSAPVIFGPFTEEMKEMDRYENIVSKEGVKEWLKIFNIEMMRMDSMLESKERELEERWRSTEVDHGYFLKMFIQQNFFVKLHSIYVKFNIEDPAGNLTTSISQLNHLGKAFYPVANFYFAIANDYSLLPLKAVLLKSKSYQVALSLISSLFLSH